MSPNVIYQNPSFIHSIPPNHLCMHPSRHIRFYQPHFINPILPFHPSVPSRAIYPSMDRICAYIVIYFVSNPCFRVRECLFCRVVSLNWKTVIEACRLVILPQKVRFVQGINCSFYYVCKWLLMLFFRKYNMNSSLLYLTLYLTNYSCYVDYKLSKVSVFKITAFYQYYFLKFNCYCYWYLMPLLLLSGRGGESKGSHAR